jgi:hypothetical protein
MSHSITRTVVLCTGILAATLSAAIAAEILPLEQRAQGVVILRNGQVIEGRISRDDGLYIVDLPDGQIRLKAADVDLACRNLEDGYQQKRTAIQAGNVHDHLELAQWCLKHDLLGPAAAELADATAVDPNNPMIDALQHRLKMAVEPQKLTDGTGSATIGPSNEDLDRMIRGLPHGAVETFTQLVQPVLMNHCTSSGCHGPQSESSLRLFRTSGNKMASRRITQRNLYSVLQFINMDNPQASRLLSAPTEPHGTARYAIFNEHQALQYKRLVDWTNQLSHQPASESPSTVGAFGVIEPPSWFVPDGGPQTLPQDPRKPRQLPANAQGQAARRGPAHISGKTVGEASPAAYNQSADPHDPDLFNRRYAPEVKQPSDGTPPSPQ